MKSGPFEILIASPPDREKLVAEVHFRNEQVVEISQDKESLQIEIAAYRTGVAWRFDFEDFLEALQTAKKHLLGQ
ncbi:hypothetical protein [Dongia mobilis]|jgi:hypothetical protein|uniref:hypothetical protein n=1 Tax=Dongia sp. TaxID=1977262 RepID=UPI0026EFFFA9